MEIECNARLSEVTVEELGLREEPFVWVDEPGSGDAHPTRWSLRKSGRYVGSSNSRRSGFNRAGIMYYCGVGADGELNLPAELLRDLGVISASDVEFRRGACGRWLAHAVSEEEKMDGQHPEDSHNQHSDYLSEAEALLGEVANWTALGTLRADPRHDVGVGWRADAICARIITALTWGGVDVCHRLPPVQKLREGKVLTAAREASKRLAKVRERISSYSLGDRPSSLPVALLREEARLVAASTAPVKASKYETVEVSIGAYRAADAAYAEVWKIYGDAQRARQVADAVLAACPPPSCGGEEALRAELDAAWDALGVRGDARCAAPLSKVLGDVLAVRARETELAEKYAAEWREKAERALSSYDSLAGEVCGEDDGDVARLPESCGYGPEPLPKVVRDTLSRALREAAECERDAGYAQEAQRVDDARRALETYLGGADSYRTAMPRALLEEKWERRARYLAGMLAALSSCTTSMLPYFLSSGSDCTDAVALVEQVRGERVGAKGKVGSVRKECVARLLALAEEKVG